MAVKTILSIEKAENILKSRSDPVVPGDPETEQIIRDLKDTLLATPNGVGLAAPQIGYLKRIFVLKKDYVIKGIDPGSDLALSDQEVLVFVNPKIISEKGQLNEEEGCLSVPDRYVKIKRARVVKLKAQDENGRQFYVRMENLASRAVQQEIDHLNGIIILDHQQ
jgi:peptide deformylase